MLVQISTEVAEFSTRKPWLRMRQGCDVVCGSETEGKRRAGGSVQSGSVRNGGAVVIISTFALIGRAPAVYEPEWTSGLLAVVNDEPSLL
jgi:hypothetical protein